MNAKTMNAETTLTREQSMTIQGTIQKSSVLFLLLLGAAFYAWQQLTSSAVGINGTVVQKYAMISGLIGFAVAMATIFLKKYAGFLAPLYALVEGFFLGSISLMFESMFPGIVMQAVLGTMAAFGVMLFMYQAKIIRVTEKFRSVMLIATGAIAVTYLLSFVLSFFGVQMGFLHNSSLLSIGISLVVIVVASLNLLLDFDMIEAYEGRVPKYMEWYCGFSLLITLVWLYMEMLRLLAKIQSRD